MMDYSKNLENLLVHDSIFKPNSLFPSIDDKENSIKAKYDLTKEEGLSPNIKLLKSLRKNNEILKEQINDDIGGKTNKENSFISIETLTHTTTPQESEANLPSKRKKIINELCLLKERGSSREEFVDVELLNEKCIKEVYERPSKKFKTEKQIKSITKDLKFPTEKNMKYPNPLENMPRASQQLSLIKLRKILSETEKSDIKISSERISHNLNLKTDNTHVNKLPNTNLSRTNNNTNITYGINPLIKINKKSKNTDRDLNLKRTVDQGGILCTLGNDDINIERSQIHILSTHSNLNNSNFSHANHMPAIQNKKRSGLSLFRCFC